MPARSAGRLRRRRTAALTLLGLAAVCAGGVGAASLSSSALRGAATPTSAAADARAPGRLGAYCRPSARVAAALLARQSSDAQGTVASEGCPATLSDKAKAALPYFAQLHTLLVDGNGHLEGCRNGSAQEHYVGAFKDELECVFGTFVDDRCGSLPSQNDGRQERWETVCLDPAKDMPIAYDLMTADEKAYFFRAKQALQERQVYATYMELASYKEIVCMFVKMVDDECLAFKKPRLLPPSYWAKKKKEA
eukprot:TRINITY_DN30586_c0_g3_i2.p1 TRINITY_DN30586_c0_g3~~TRINITY_DN30586_c0_g3_i2.p1  ORF type:complete len:250 (-),score=67.60 TRINITY_DN30586_c0_g3_i2:65-814(-)